MDREFKVTRKIMLKPFSLFYVFMSGGLFAMNGLMINTWSASIVILVGIIAALILTLVDAEVITVKSPTTLDGYTVIMEAKK
ncbi:MAG: hypothetical protein COC02_05480 [Rhodospirillaceae bacterium]|nr:MAG: hypothetical protein COC02_05480 [Rhodospirillaceae bacterium]